MYTDINLFHYKYFYLEIFYLTNQIKHNLMSLELFPVGIISKLAIPIGHKILKESSLFHHKNLYHSFYVNIVLQINISEIFVSINV